jgi:hypothetical protein
MFLWRWTGEMGQAGLTAKLNEEARALDIDPEEYKHNYRSSLGKRTRP